MTVGDLLRRLDSREITEWMAYFQVKREMAESGGKPKIASADSIRAAFAHRIKRKG